MTFIYIAAPWKDKDLMPAIADKFERKGYVITWKWWLTDDIAEGDKTAAKLAEQAYNDKEGVEAAERLILLNTAKSEGKAVEQGIALALDIPIIAIGKRGDGTSLNVFHYLDAYEWYDTVEAYLED